MSLSSLLYIHFRITELNGIGTLGTFIQMWRQFCDSELSSCQRDYTNFFYISFCMCVLTVLWKAVTRWLSEILETGYCFS